MIAQNPARTTASMWYRCDTDWGVAYIGWNGRTVTRLRPSVAPGTQQQISVHDDDENALLAAEPSQQAPAQVRNLVAALQEYYRDPTVEFVSQALLADWLDELDIRGFRRSVMLELARVPAGATVTYGQLAELAGRPQAARAVGSACARNPLPLIVPCHRVIHAGAPAGDVGSYGAGTGPDYKRRLLEHERAPHVVSASEGLIF